MIIHVNTGNQVHICVSDVIDALHDYAWIHFTEEEALFMNNVYPCYFYRLLLNVDELPSV